MGQAAVEGDAPGQDRHDQLDLDQEEREEQEERARQLAVRLAREFAGVPADVVEQRVSAAFGQFADAPIRDYVGVFVERTVRTELRSRGGATGVERAL